MMSDLSPGATDQQLSGHYFQIHALPYIDPWDRITVVAVAHHGILAYLSSNGGVGVARTEAEVGVGTYQWVDVAQEVLARALGR